jgi:hypothetical protein
VDPLPLDEDVEFVPAMAGIPVVSDDSPAQSQPEKAAPDMDGRPRGGIFRIPRDYR